MGMHEGLEWPPLAGRSRQHADLLQLTRDVGDRPVFDDLAVTNSVNHNAFGLDLFVRGGDAEELSCVDAAAEDLADDEIILGNLHPDLVTPGSRYPEDLCRLLHSLTIQANAGNRRIVRDEILRDVLVKDRPVARLVGVDRLDVAPDQFLVSIG